MEGIKSLKITHKNKVLRFLLVGVKINKEHDHVIIIEDLKSNMKEHRTLEVCSCITDSTHRNYLDQKFTRNPIHLDSKTLGFLNFGYLRSQLITNHV